MRKFQVHLAAAVILTAFVFSCLLSPTEGKRGRLRGKENYEDESAENPPEVITHEENASEESESEGPTNDSPWSSFTTAFQGAKGMLSSAFHTAKSQLAYLTPGFLTNGEKPAAAEDQI